MVSREAPPQIVLWANGAMNTLGSWAATFRISGKEYRKIRITLRKHTMPHVFLPLVHVNVVDVVGRIDVSQHSLHLKIFSFIN